LTRRRKALLYRFRTRSIQKELLNMFPPRDLWPLSTSALPGAPVVAAAGAREPGRGRLAAAALLRRLADRLDTEPRVVAA
jgi:hypothetical protein